MFRVTTVVLLVVQLLLGVLVVLRQQSTTLLLPTLPIAMAFPLRWTANTRRLRLEQSSTWWSGQYHRCNTAIALSIGKPAKVNGFAYRGYTRTYMLVTKFPRRKGDYNVKFRSTTNDDTGKDVLDDEIEPAGVGMATSTREIPQSLSKIGHTDTYYDSNIDEKFLQMAVDAAQLGYGYTFPNPAVGCILVLSTITIPVAVTNQQPIVNYTILGRGYHPRAGYPHAEIFALLEAAKHIPSGVEAATSVIQHYNYHKSGNSDRDGLEYDKEEQRHLYETVVSLTKQYQGTNGTRALFENCLQPYLLTDDNQNAETSSNTIKTITAYVTLEPCCHTGKRTPPCTNSLLVSNGISRIVVGARDPNPQVDGGGIQILQQQQQQQHSHPSQTTTTNISVVDIPSSYFTTAGTAPYHCKELITNFAKRITVPLPKSEMTGRTKRILRTLAAQMLNNSTLPTVSWGSYSGTSNKSGGNTVSAASIDVDVLLENAMANSNPGDVLNKNGILEEAVNQLEILPNWLEHVDGVLWQHELVLLRLNKAISKRKGSTFLGNRIAQQLQATVVQTKGHTVLLYRPSSATDPIIDIHNHSNIEDDSENDDEDVEI